MLAVLQLASRPPHSLVTGSLCGDRDERKFFCAGLAEYFRNSSEEEREHAEKLMIQQVPDLPALANLPVDRTGL